MTSPNRYLAVIPARTPIAVSSIARVTLPVSLASAMFAVAVAMFSPGIVSIGVVATSIATFAGVLVWRTRTRSRAVREILDAADDVLLESFDEASEHIRRALATRMDPLLRGETLALLGRCASMRGDFADAAVLLDLALKSLGSRRLARHMDAHHLISQLRPQRAFALLASGDIEGARKVLALPPVVEVHPAAAALVTRAKALLHWKSNERDALLALLTKDRMLVHTFLAVRDRTLLHVLESRARDASGELQIAVSADIARWIERVAPDLSPSIVPS